MYQSTARILLFPALLLALLSLLACDADILPPETDLATHNPTGTGNATLSWQPPTERVDGSPLTKLSGYRILYGQQSRRYSYSIEITNPGLTRYFIDGLSEGWWYFAIVAIDSQGLASAESAEASTRI
ncbi:fibronectin type III domain-containing protein [Thioalkalivibrio sp. XN279]|uniref:fibronectin type III domain-containing protein n=1 Tax=Thioalkalivibrio sp. XN279 TaxID=2714953 RepID=UPI001409CD22|nr:fibronectin type III domain-containing protein [Thioalkalivibrio sp. XN279]NHA15342.1 fibronectin type III domain-containing protein [Thioalkalivibrio sp. XN279]